MNALVFIDHNNNLNLCIKPFMRLYAFKTDFRATLNSSIEIPFLAILLLDPFEITHNQNRHKPLFHVILSIC